VNIKAISIQNPTSYLVACGAKNVENRTWKTDYRGWLYIHSSGGKDYSNIFADDFPEAVDRIQEGSPEDLRILARMAIFNTKLLAHYGVGFNATREECKAAEKAHGFYLRAGCIIGRVRLVDIVKDSHSPWSEAGCNHWILEDAELFDKPIPNVVGRLRLFDVEI